MYLNFIIGSNKIKAPHETKYALFGQTEYHRTEPCLVMQRQ